MARRITKSVCITHNKIFETHIKKGVSIGFCPNCLLERGIELEKEFIKDLDRDFKKAFKNKIS